jgi:hypothetical protein
VFQRAANFRKAKLKSAGQRHLGHGAIARQQQFLSHLTEGSAHRKRRDGKRRRGGGGRARRCGGLLAAASRERRQQNGEYEET